MDEMEKLEQLRVLANNISGDSSTPVEKEEDIPVEVVNRGFMSDPWTKDGKTVEVIRGTTPGDTGADPIRGGNSGNNPSRIDFNALLEKCSGDPDADRRYLGESLFHGMSIRKAAAKTEAENGCKVMFDPGTVVKPTKGGKSIYIVKNNDGEMIMCAKPTNIESDMTCGGTDGCWPQFAFQQDDIEPAGVDLDTLAVLADIVAHNDNVAASSCCKSQPCEEGERLPENFEKMREMMEDIYGPIPQEKLVSINKFGIPEQPEEPETPKFNFDEPRGYFAD